MNRFDHRLAKARIRTLIAAVGMVLVAGVSVRGQIPGCTDPLATNFNSAATQNDGSCVYPATSIGTLFSQVLDTSLLEISGLTPLGSGLLCIVDQNDNVLFEIDTLNGTISAQLSCGALTNYNWEEIEQDSLYIYLGDIGNNINGNRTDLRIYRMEKTSLLAGNPLVDTIAFTYSTQTDFTPTGLNNTDYDCEAFVVTTDSIFIFTKQWISLGTVVFSLPNQPGLHSAAPVDSFNVQGLITGATTVKGKQAVLLCGYTNLVQPFLYLLYDYSNHRFFSGNKRKVGLNLPFHQIEAICTNNGIRYYLANEGLTNRFVTISQQLHLVDLGNLLLHYLYPVSTGISNPGKDETPSPYPNPTSNRLWIKNSFQLVGRSYRVLDSIGQMITSGVFVHEIDAGHWAKGIYLIHFEGLQPFRISKL